MKAYLYDEQGKYIGHVDCQIDPLESQNARKEVFLIPANATTAEPLPSKDGFDVVFNNTEWEYRAIPEPTPDPEPTPPTKLDQLYNELFECQNKLSGYDYIGIKIATGRATREEYADKIAEMDNLAKKVDELKSEIAIEQANVENSKESE